jgi:hypothetical protein
MLSNKRAAPFRNFAGFWHRVKPYAQFRLARVCTSKPTICTLIDFAGQCSFEAHSRIFFTIVSGRLPLFKVCKIPPALSSSSRVTMEKPMDWLFTDENLATAIVIVGFCLFVVVLILLAR